MLAICEKKKKTCKIELLNKSWGKNLIIFRVPQYSFTKRLSHFCIDHTVTQHRKLYRLASPGLTMAQAPNAGKVSDPSQLSLL